MVYDVYARVFVKVRIAAKCVIYYYNTVPTRRVEFFWTA